MPCTVVIGETLDVRGYSSTSGDIVIDDILMTDDLPEIMSLNGNGIRESHFRTCLHSRSKCDPYVHCHVANVSVGDYVRSEYKHLDPNGVVGIWLAAPGLTAAINVSTVVKWDSIEGNSTWCTVDIVIIGTKGLKKMPDSFFSECAITDGLFFTSANVSKVDYTFEKRIRMPETDSGNYYLLAFTPGRDGSYAR